MSKYEKKTIDGKTVWVPKTQEPIERPKQAERREKVELPKRVGKKYGERKNWW